LNVVVVVVVDVVVDLDGDGDVNLVGDVGAQIIFVSMETTAARSSLPRSWRASVMTLRSFMMSREAAHSMAAPRAILLRFALSASDQRPTLGDVSDDGLGGACQLICAVCVASGQSIDDVVREREELDGPLIYVETLKTEHVAHRLNVAAVASTGNDHLHVAVAVKVHDHVDDHDHDHDYVDVKAPLVEPQVNARDLEQREEAGLGLVVASPDGSKPLELVEADLDEIADAVELAVVAGIADECGAVRVIKQLAGRDHLMALTGR